AQQNSDCLSAWLQSCREISERERMREREKAARESVVLKPNGHLFTSLTVSGTTLCSACNKSITAKEALCCPTCSATIHNRCRDTLPNCAKMKQRQQKTALMKNNVPLRAKKRPTSAIYPSESFRQSLLRSRRGRSHLSLSKSVSTNNIVGSLNDDAPLGLRRILSQSTDSLSFRNRTMSMESLNDDGELYYASVLEEIELEGQDFKADSWSMAVDSSYLQTHRKNVIKRQDVIYELIHTELHHMQTLQIMERVFRQGMLEELQLEPSTVHAMFPCLDQLIKIHSQFLAQLLLRRKNSLQPGSNHNYTIHQLGDILVEQFSGQSADDMQKTYAEFCSRHLKAVKLYKELLAKDKKFQFFIRQVSRGPLLRCHGVQECILLVTQRMFKYPALIQRILDNTTDDEEEASSVAQALLMIRELLSSIDQQMDDLEKTQRLQEIHAKLDPRAEAIVRDGGIFKAGELLRRRLIREGTLFWKTPGSRLKDIQVLLMSDILVFLQEKDQRCIFPSMDKPPVLSLQNLIVRDIANQERGMYLISDSTPPEMYEFYAASKDDKNIWIRHVQHAVSKWVNAHTTHAKAFHRFVHKDQEMLELLQERVTLFCELAEVTSGQESLQPPITRYLFRADTPQAPRAEKLLLDATSEGNYPRFILEICQRLVNLSVYLHALQGAVIKQDSILELLLQQQGTMSPSEVWRPLLRDGGHREATVLSTIGELALLQRQHSLLQEELLRLRDAENRFKDSERARAELERQVRQMKATSGVAPASQRYGEQASQSETEMSGVYNMQANQDSVHQSSLQQVIDLEVYVTSDDDDDGTASESSKG
uniref:Rho guanine nucleotide exchange factor (GEF) 1a n=1 Tax=Astatotilapia calliptera TaxID=8154 RepID=A0AAX7T657_ASTCA